MGTMGRISALSATFPHGALAWGKRPNSDSQGLGQTGTSPPCFLLPLHLSLRVLCLHLGPNPLWSVPLSPCRPTPPAEAQRLPYYATYCPTRLLIHSMCTSHYLDIFITCIICLNVVTMSLEHYNQPTVSLARPLARGHVAGLGPQQDPTPGAEPSPLGALCSGGAGPGRREE